MYEAYYGLKEKPFNLTPDPRFLYLSEKHKEAFAHLLYGIKNHSGFVMVSGEIGTGKTTICRTLINQLDEETEVAFIFNPCLSPEDLLRRINEDFGIQSTGTNAKELIDELNAHLLERSAQGKNCVLIVDEAQNLSPEVLEQVRLLSNLETETQKLFQIVLVGQPELLDNLTLPELRQLDQRITARYHLLPLDREEMVQYIAYRLRVAGGRRKVRFTRKAIQVLYRESGGTPRVINSICDRALLIGYSSEQHEMTHTIVRRAAKEIRGDHAMPLHRQRRPLFSGAPTMLATAVLAVIVTTLALSPLINDARVSAFKDSVRSYVASWRTPQEPAVAFEESEFEAAPVFTKLEEIEPAAKPTLAAVLEAMDSDAARNAGLAGLLERWGAPVRGRPAKNDSLDSLQEFAIAHDLMMEAFSPTLDQMETIDLPFLAKMKGKRQRLWLAVVGLSDDCADIVDHAGVVVRVPRTAFQNRYEHQAVVLWRDPKPGAAVMAKGVSGSQVRGLQQQLLAHGRLDADPSGRYDTATIASIEQLQRDTGLKVDGVAGGQTRMVLTSWGTETVTPSLTGRAESERTLIAKSTPDSEAAAETTAPTPDEPPVTLDVAEEPVKTAPTVRFARDAKPQVVRAADALVTALLADPDPTPPEAVVAEILPAEEAQPLVAEEPLAAEADATETVEAQVEEPNEALAEPAPAESIEPAVVVVEAIEPIEEESPVAADAPAIIPAATEVEAVAPEADSVEAAEPEAPADGVANPVADEEEAEPDVRLSAKLGERTPVVLPGLEGPGQALLPDWLTNQHVTEPAVSGVPLVPVEAGRLPQPQPTTNEATPE